MDTKALRQKILDLAIRGKLVPQDLNDEPASVLLDRIRTEKQQMVKDGKLKAKDIKNDTVIFKGEDNLHYEKFADGSVKCIEDEIPFELLEGWEWTRLQTICEPITDGTHKTPHYSENGYIFLSSKNVTSGKIDWNDVVYIPEDLHNELYTRLAPQKNDILLAKNGTTGIAAKVDRDCVFDIYVSLALIRIIKYMLSPEYIIYAISSSTVQNYFSNSLKGIGVPNLHLEHIRATLVPVAPANEQIKIVNQLSRLISFVDNIELEKSGLLATIRLAKSKILDLAIRGKLVPQDPNDEPASVLLERIRAEKEELIKQGKIKRDKNESVIFRGEDNSYYDVLSNMPESWEIAALVQLNFFQSANINPMGCGDNKFELYSVPHYEFDMPEILNGKEIGSTKQVVYNGDVLICKINPRINRVWIVEHITEFQTIASSEWIVFRNKNLYAPYMRVYFTSSFFRDLLLTNVSGVGRSLMRAQPESVKKYPILIPPYREQKRIADKVSQLFSMLDSIEKSLL